MKLLLTFAMLVSFTEGDRKTTRCPLEECTNSTLLFTATNQGTL